METMWSNLAPIQAERGLDSGCYTEQESGSEVTVESNLVVKSFVRDKIPVAYSLGKLVCRTNLAVSVLDTSTRSTQTILEASKKPTRTLCVAHHIETS